MTNDDNEVLNVNAFDILMKIGKNLKNLSIAKISYFQDPKLSEQQKKTCR